MELESFLSKTILYDLDFGHDADEQSHNDQGAKSAAFDRIVETHAGVCEQFDALHEELSSKMADGSFKSREYSEISTHCLPSRTLGPLFRSLITVVLDTQDENDVDVELVFVLTGDSKGETIPMSLFELSSQKTHQVGRVTSITTTLPVALQ